MMFSDKLTETAVEVMNRAREEALRMDAVAVDVEHVLLGLLGVSGGVAYFALNRNRIFWQPVHELLWNQARDRRDNSAHTICPSENIHTMTLRAFELSKESKEDLIHTEHLLLALTEIKSWRTRDVFDSLAVDLTELRKDIRRAALFAKGKGTNIGGGGHERATMLPIGLSVNLRRSRVIEYACDEASRLGHNFVGTEQILLGILREETSVARILLECGVTYQLAASKVESIIGRGTGFVAVEIPFTPRAKRVLELSWDEARQLGHDYIGTEHLLLGLIREREGVAWRVLELLRVDIENLRKAVIDSFSQGNEKRTGSF